MARSSSVICVLFFRPRCTVESSACAQDEYSKKKQTQSDFASVRGKQDPMRNDVRFHHECACSMLRGPVSESFSLLLAHGQE
jgi:hypothetical protein